MCLISPVFKYLKKFSAFLGKSSKILSELSPYVTYSFCVMQSSFRLLGKKTSVKIFTLLETVLLVIDIKFLSFFFYETTSTIQLTIFSQP